MPPLAVDCHEPEAQAFRSFVPGACTWMLSRDYRALPDIPI